MHIIALKHGAKHCTRFSQTYQVGIVLDRGHTSPNHENTTGVARREKMAAISTATKEVYDDTDNLLVRSLDSAARTVKFIEGHLCMITNHDYYD